MLSIGQNIKNNGYSNVIVYGAGEAGKKLIRALKMCNISIECIVDRNEKLWGSTIEEIEIVSLEQAISKNINVFAFGSFAFIDDIINNISKIYKEENSKVCIFSILRKESIL